MLDVILLRRVALLFFAGSSVYLMCHASQIAVDATMTLSDLIARSTHVFVVEHGPPRKPLVSNLSVVHLRIIKTLKGSTANRNEILQVIHFQEDLLASYKRSAPHKSLLVHGYKSPLALEEALKGRFIVFLSLRNARFHFVAPGAYETMKKLSEVRALLKAASPAN